LFDGINLEEVTVSQTINAPAWIFLAFYVALAEKQGADFRKISGTLQNDILKEYIAQKEWIYPIKPAMKLVIDTFEFCTKARSEIQSDLVSAAITSAKPARPLCRNSRSRCATASNTSNTASNAEWTLTNSCRASRFSLTRTTTFSRRSPNTAPPRRLGKDDERAFRREKSANDADAFSHADGRRFADRPAAL
jgi:hypothetical protein